MYPKIYSLFIKWVHVAETYHVQGEQKKFKNSFDLIMRNTIFCIFIDYDILDADPQTRGFLLFSLLCSRTPGQGKSVNISGVSW